MLIGLWIRTSIAESPLFQEVQSKGEQAKMPLLEVITKHPRGLLVSMGLRTAPMSPSTPSPLTS